MAEESVLQRLLNKELEAQQRVDEAFRERDALIDNARKEVRAAEERFAKRIPDLYQSYLSNAEQDAEQAVAEVNRRYQESAARLRSMAQAGRDEGLADALDILLDADKL
jgi:vacuolar-type H+-ATPase subunit H